MARYKFPFTKRDKYAVFGGDDRELEELEDQEFYIKGAIYKPAPAQNSDGTIQLQAINFEKRKAAIPPDIYKRFFASQPLQPGALNEDSWSNAPPGMSPPREGTPSMTGPGTPVGEESQPLKGSPASLSVSQVGYGGPQTPQPLLGPPGGPHPLANTTLGTIPEERVPYPDDFVIKYYASITDMFWVVFSLITYLAHMGFDIWVAVILLLNEEYLFFGLTLGFIVVPAFTMTFISLFLYIRDWKVVGEKASPFRWLVRALFLILQISPIMRMIDVFAFGFRSRRTKDTGKQKTLYDRMIDEDVDLTLLRLFEAFLQAGPQIVLQLYIMTQLGLTRGPIVVTAQCVCMGVSLLTMSSLLVAFHKILRLSQPDKALLTRPGMFIMFLWRCFTIASRCLAFAVFAAKFQYFVAVAIGVHWIVMLVWMFKQDTRYCMLVNREGKEKHNRCFEMVFRFTAAYMQIFDFFNLIEGHTRLRCLVYYGLVFVENLAMVLTFYVAAAVDGTPLWYDAPATLFVTIGFGAGIVCQVFYYKCCHPNNFSMMHEDRKVAWCRKWNDVSMCYDLGWNLDLLDDDDEDFDNDEIDNTAEMYKNSKKVPPGGRPPPSASEVSSQAPLKSALKKRPLPHPPTSRYIRGGSKRSSASSNDSVRSNFEHRTDMDDATRQKLNLSYRPPEKLDDLIGRPVPAPRGNGGGEGGTTV